MDGGPACLPELTHVPVHLANPLGILVANLVSPILVKTEEDIPLMVRELTGACVCAPLCMVYSVWLCLSGCVFACVCVHVCGLCVLVRVCTCAGVVGSCTHTIRVCALAPSLDTGLSAPHVRGASSISSTGCLPSVRDNPGHWDAGCFSWRGESTRAARGWLQQDEALGVGGVGRRMRDQRERRCGGGETEGCVC